MDPTSSLQTGVTRLRRHRGTVAAVLAIALFAWPFVTLSPGVDGDWNWNAALAVAAEHRRPFGGELIFTYGPLGFLEVDPRLYFSGPTLVAFAYQGLLQLLLAATFLLAARRSHPWPAAFALAYVAVAVVPTRTIALGFAWCVLALTASGDRGETAAARLFPPAIGLLCGVALLGKLNFGVELVALAAIALACRPGRRGRDAIAFAAALLAAAAVGWLATGQTVDGVWPYVRYGFEIVRGYAPTQGAAPAEQWYYWAALLLFAIPSALVWANARQAPPWQRWGLVALWSVYAFASFKQGFVRAGDAHVALFATAMLAAIAVLPAPPARRWPAATASGVVASLALIVALGFGSLLADRLDPLRSAGAVAEQARTLADGSRRLELRAAHVEAIRRHYGLSDRLAARVGDRTLAFWPFNYGDLVYAYGFNWRSLPALNPLAPTTAAIDRAGAEMLRSDRAPERILRRGRQAAAADFSLAHPPLARVLEPPYDPPLTAREIFCRYRELSRSAPWQLLVRRADRCLPSRAIGHATAAWGDPVPVPRARPGSALLVRIEGTEPAGLELLRELLLRPAPRFVLFDGRAARLDPSAAPGGLLIGAAPGRDYRAPFAMAPNPATIAVARVGDQPGGMLRYSFVELPVDAPASARAG